MRTKEEIALKVLKILGMGIVFTAISVLAPQFPYLLLRHYLKKKFNSNYNDLQMQRTVSYLKRKKFIAYSKNRFELTELGRRYLQKAQALELNIPQVPWDGKWRIVSFDVPENLKPSRQIFRRILKQFGFFHFQRSVFILPYPCEKELESLARTLRIDEFVFVMTAERFNGDKKILKKFGL